MTQISTHILDLSLGQPAPNVPLRVERQYAGHWRLLASARTDRDGRCSRLLPEEEGLSAGVYRLSFDTAAYFAARDLESLYPVVEITFQVRDGEQHFHLPLLLSPYGFSTYRGS
ncbi:MAG: hydroxyisourate hydrolase [Terriglobales bacterium]|jgi:hydroxyisourate hydrolase